MSLQFSHGFLGVFFDQLDPFIQHFINNYDVVIDVMENMHITLLTKSELKELDTKVDISSIQLDYIDMGIGKMNDIVFKLVYWKSGNEFRDKLGLPLKDFHISLTKHSDYSTRQLSHLIPMKYNCYIADNGFEERYSVAKLLINDKDILHFVYLLKASTLSTALQAKCINLCAFIHLNRNQYELAIVEAISLLEFDKKLGYVRLGDAWSKTNVKLSCVAYLHAWHYEADKTYILKKCSKYTDFWINLIDENDLELYTAHSNLFELKKMTDINQITDFLSTLQSQPPIIDVKTRYYVNTHKMPRKVSWVVPGVLMGTSTPRNKLDIEAFKELQIKTVITLTEETPLEKEWFNDDIVNIYVPVTNYKAPKFDQIDYCLQFIMKSAYSLHQQEINATLVHCGGGIGRAGTIIACYLLRFGFKIPHLCTNCSTLSHDILWLCPDYCCTNELPVMTPEQAILLTRQIRPMSIETVEQEIAIKQYCSLLYKRKYTPEPVYSGPDLTIYGQLPKKPLYIICCGLPASGKSWFSQQLKGYNWTSQDETGKQGFMKSLNKQKYKILDRCNVTKQDRKDILESLFYPQHTICVYFNVSLEICSYRGHLRLTHPTLVNPDNALKQFNSILEEPQLEEGFVSVCHVHTFEGSKQLLQKLGIVFPEQFFKFPRTCHLLNLGSATRDDLVLGDTDIKLYLTPPLDMQLTVEEKIDGANLGVRIINNAIHIQNRSHYVNSSSHTQFKSLDKWISKHSIELHSLLKSNFILFGEWMAAKHSIHYKSLPDVFIAFDLYDINKGQFLSRHLFYSKLNQTSIPVINKLTVDFKSVQDIEASVQQPSMYYDGKIEGIYLRLDKGDYLFSRSKVVRSDFITGNDHWTKGIIEYNTFIE